MVSPSPVVRLQLLCGSGAPGKGGGREGGGSHICGTAVMFSIWLRLTSGPIAPESHFGLCLARSIHHPSLHSTIPPSTTRPPVHQRSPTENPDHVMFEFKGFKVSKPHTDQNHYSFMTLLLNDSSSRQTWTLRSPSSRCAPHTLSLNPNLILHNQFCVYAHFHSTLSKRSPRRERRPN